MYDPKLLKDAGEYLKEIDKSLKMRQKGYEIANAKAKEIEGNAPVDPDYQKSEALLLKMVESRQKEVDI